MQHCHSRCDDHHYAFKCMALVPATSQNQWELCWATNGSTTYDMGMSSRSWISQAILKWGRLRAQGCAEEFTHCILGWMQAVICVSLEGLSPGVRFDNLQDVAVSIGWLPGSRVP
ncbi:hypothetical protein FOC1_g10008712 [Fusarium oxysporum f. sp. cubense race 1]|uniref:Uncharacterized protein n=1 Tax=Fusarium oxysporum f. sp. cubense (strain race 1) TaxID=1229664 RepID=N4UWR9_FUSC1|nr:hypothetical protein FOC1_g10008712 [Fusarium oxysporum f. sp. cubense race 1]